MGGTPLIGWPYLEGGVAGAEVQPELHAAHQRGDAALNGQRQQEQRPQVRFIRQKRVPNGQRNTILLRLGYIHIAHRKVEKKLFYFIKCFLFYPGDRMGKVEKARFLFSKSEKIKIRIEKEKRRIDG